MPSHLPYAAIAVSILVLLIPAALWLERTNVQMWSSRLWQPPYKMEPNRHTPRTSAGTPFPTITADIITLRQADNPYILTEPMTIPSDTTLIIEPGVHVLAHEFTHLTVLGTLRAEGTLEAPIEFSTNELHPENQTWSGIMFAPQSRSTLANVHIKYASPGLTCQAGSSVEGSHVHTQFGLVGLYTESSTCHLKNSRLQAIEHSVVTRGDGASPIDTALTAKHPELILNIIP